MQASSTFASRFKKSAQDRVGVEIFLTRSRRQQFFRRVFDFKPHIASTQQPQRSLGKPLFHKHFSAYCDIGMGSLDASTPCG